MRQHESLRKDASSIASTFDHHEGLPHLVIVELTPPSSASMSRPWKQATAGSVIRRSSTESTES